MRFQTNFQFILLVKNLNIQELKLLLVRSIFHKPKCSVDDVVQIIRDFTQRVVVIIHVNSETIEFLVLDMREFFLYAN